MNSSAVSVYENLSSQDSDGDNSEALTFLVNDILQILNLNEAVVFCPLCSSSFSKVRDLKSHLKKFHCHFILELLHRSVVFVQCSFCSAKLCNVHVAGKHCLSFHIQLLIGTFFSVQPEGVHCIFCESTVPRIHFGEHLLEKHSYQYINWFSGKFNLQYGGMVGLVEVGNFPNASSSNCVDEDDLNKQLQKLALVKDSNDVSKSILKSSDTRASKKKLSVRRELRFSFADKENSSPRPRRRAGSYDCSALQNCNYQCAKCSVCFSSHQQLVNHVKTQHKKYSLNLLHPLYQCALCGAKFYKNSYLKKHCFVHNVKKIR